MLAQSGISVWFISGYAFAIVGIAWICDLSAKHINTHPVGIVAALFIINFMMAGYAHKINGFGQIHLTPKIGW